MNKKVSYCKQITHQHESKIFFARAGGMVDLVKIFPSSSLITITLSGCCVSYCVDVGSRSQKYRGAWALLLGIGIVHDHAEICPLPTCYRAKIGRSMPKCMAVMVPKTLGTLGHCPLGWGM